MMRSQGEELEILQRGTQWLTVTMNLVHVCGMTLDCTGSPTDERDSRCHLGSQYHTHNNTL